MSKSERKSLVRFLAIYLGSTLTLISLAGWGFYLVGKRHIIAKQYESLEAISAKLLSHLRILHHSDQPVLYYPTYKNIRSAIYDIEGNYLYGTFPSPLPLERAQKSKTHISVVKHVEPYYLGTAKLVVSTPLQKAPILALRQDIFTLIGVSALLFSILGYFLGKLFIKPMRDAVNTLNRFIQDTTHELNTPISTILTNIEMIEALRKCGEAKGELKRIAIASKTLHRIYDDLSFLNLNYRYHRKSEPLDMGKLLQERLTYFELMIRAKRLHVSHRIEDNVIIRIDPNDAIRLIDNLLSNAIKYNKPEGALKITLDTVCLKIEDEGEGIDPHALDTIRTRFARANNSEGGFGIGLHIVDSVVTHYGFSLTIDSIKTKGTKVTIAWNTQT